MPTSASSAIWCTSFSVTMVHPDDVVYVILHGRFISIFTGKLLEHSPYAAPVLHRFLLVPCEIPGNVAFCDRPERDLTPAVLHFFFCGDLLCSAHHPQVKVGHGKVRSVEGGDRLVTCRLLPEAGKVPGQVGFERGGLQVAGVSPEEFIGTLPRGDALVTVFPGPACDEVLGERDAGIDRVL